MSEPDEPRRPGEPDEHPGASEAAPHRCEREGPGKDIWTPVVYGRTRRADRWWRAVPADVEPDWLAAVITGVTAGGRDLDQGPRFLLAQNRSSRLVGVACRAAEISTSMNSDGSRPLYCFVGWCAPLAGADGEGPALGELRDRYAHWAALVYEEWMRADWETHPSRLHQPHEPPPGPAPWTAARTETAVPSRPVPESGTFWSADEMFWPADDADVPWHMAKDSRLPCTVSIGWRRARDAQALTGTRSVVVAEDISEPSTAPLPSPSPSESSPPQPGTAPSAPNRDPHEDGRPPGGEPADPPQGRPTGRSGTPSVPPALRPTPVHDSRHRLPADPKTGFALPPGPVRPGSPVGEEREERGRRASRTTRKDRAPHWSPLLSLREWGRRARRKDSSPGDRSRNRPRPEDDEW